MFKLSLKFTKYFIVISLFTGCLGLSLNAQNSDGEAEVPVIQQIGSKSYGCYRENGIIDEEKHKTIADKNCSELYKLLKIDFAKHTLIGYGAGGDCFLRVKAAVFRSDESKKYTVRIKNYWGGCRAGGSFQGWLVIEKIPPGYTIDFVETKVDSFGKKDAENILDLNSGLAPKDTLALQKLETRSIDLETCIHLYTRKNIIIKDEETFLKAIRNDASRARCLQDQEKIDFDKYSLIGTEINSGYCRIPLGLTHQVFKDEEKKQYILSISYIAPNGTCRALSRYDLWIIAPKIPEEYTVSFEITAEPSAKK